MISGLVACPDCDGTGNVIHALDWRRCRTCDGTGEMPDPAAICACCASHVGPLGAPALVDGACPACATNDCACVAIAPGAA